MSEKFDVSMIEIRQLKDEVRTLTSQLREERARGIANELELKSIRNAIVVGFWALIVWGVLSIMF